MNIGLLLAALGVGAFVVTRKTVAGAAPVAALPKKPKPQQQPAPAEALSVPKFKYRMVIWTDLDPPPMNGRFVQDLASVGIRLAKVVKVNPKAFFKQWIVAESDAVVRLVVTNKEPTIAIFAFSRPVEAMLRAADADPWLTEERMYQQLMRANSIGLQQGLGKQGITLIGEGGAGFGATEFGDSGLRVHIFDQWLSQEQPWSEAMADSLVASLIDDEIPR